MFLFPKLIITNQRAGGIILCAPSLSDRGGGYRWRKLKSEISSTSQRGGVKGKWTVTTFCSCVRNENKERDFAWFPLYLWAALIFFCSFVCFFHFFFLSFSPSGGASLPPPSSVSVPGLLGAITIQKWQNGDHRRVTEIKWNEMAHEKKPTYAGVLLFYALCVCVCVFSLVYDICPPQYVLYPSFSDAVGVGNAV